MATYPAIAATGHAILTLLTTAAAGTEFAGNQFKLFEASEFKTGIAGDGGISLYLYRVAANTTLRNYPPRPSADGRRYRPPMTLDLYYLLTVWGGDADKQQRRLGWAMRILEDTSSMPAGLLNQHGPEPEIFRPQETVELILDPLSLQDFGTLWDLFKLNQDTGWQLSVTYVARLVSIDSFIELHDAGPVQTREFALGKGSTP